MERVGVAIEYGPQKAFDKHKAAGKQPRLHKSDVKKARFISLATE